MEYSSSSQRVTRRQVTDAVPLSFAQQRLWLFNQLMPGSPVHNIHSAMRLKGRLKVVALEQALNEIIRRHEVLRTTFAVVDGRPVQTITPPLALPLPMVDLRQLPETEREAESHRLATEEMPLPFELNRGPLLRAILLQIDEEEYVLLLTMHHLVSDTWSVGVLIREMATLYEAFSANKSSPLPELPTKYTDFAIRQRQWLQGKALEVQLAYWKQQLRGDIPMLQLPIDSPRLSVQTYRSARYSLELPKSLTEALKTLSQREGVTLFITLLAAFKTLLYRYTAQDDILVCSLSAGRTQAELEGLIGCFVNTLIFRTDLSGNPMFRDLLEQVHEMALEASAHQELPFEMLIEALQPKWNLSHSPFFQVMFTLRNDLKQALELPGLRVIPLEVDCGTTQFDLALEMVEKAEGLSCLFAYNSDLFNATTIMRMSRHFQTLLEGIIANPAQRIGTLPLLTDAEQHKMLIEWNDTKRDYPKDACIHQLFEAQVEQTPDTVAVIFADTQLTYRELNARANQLAHYLRQRGCRPEVLVGICMERSLEMVVGLLGILKAGGAYVPLDPAYPQERLAFMLEDTQAPVLLTQKRLVEGLPAQRVQQLCLDTDWELIAQTSEVNPISGVTADNLAYVIYTSGSTGEPKGVMIRHGALCNYMFWMQMAFPLTEADRVLQRAPFSFDASVWEFYAPLISGAQIVMSQPAAHPDSAELVSTIAQHNVTTLQLVPSLLRMLLDEPGLDSCGCLQRVFCGGEALPVELKEYFFSRLDADLYNLYGPTEATIYATFYSCGDESNQGVVLIGRPIANTQVYVLDRHLNPVPVGVPGELYISDDGLARGYLNRPELTAEKFIPNPFSKGRAVRLYKTGDMVRYWPDGNLEFLERMDHQVKLRGFRIELGEIESVLSQHPVVRESLVLAREDVPGDKHLVAYIVLNQEPAPSTNDLRIFLKAKLPEYMVPSAFVVMSALPLTPNGKIDRRALPAPDQVHPSSESTVETSHTPVEEILAGIWAEVLGLERVGVNDNFLTPTDFVVGEESVQTIG